MDTFAFYEPKLQKDVLALILTRVKIKIMNINKRLKKLLPFFLQFIYMVYFLKFRIVFIWYNQYLRYGIETLLWQALLKRCKVKKESFTPHRWVILMYKIITWWLEFPRSYLFLHLFLPIFTSFALPTGYEISFVFVNHQQLYLENKFN